MFSPINRFATIKFDTGPVRNTLVTGAEISRETVSIDSYNGLTSEAARRRRLCQRHGRAGLGAQSAELPAVRQPTVTGNPSVIPVNTKSLFALETANYRDFLIFTAGLRFDNYNISASKNGFPTVSAASNMVNYNLGLVVKPLPTASVYAAYGTSSNPVGAELDGTSANYGGLQSDQCVDQSDLRPGRSQGGGSRNQMGTLRSPSARDRGAVPHRRQQRARTRSSGVSWASWFRGYPDAALAATDRALKDAREIGHVATLLYALVHGSMVHNYCGDCSKAYAEAEEDVALAGEKSSPFWAAFGKAAQGCLSTAIGKSSGEAVQMISSGLDTLRSTGTTMWRPYHLVCLGYAFAGAGNFDDAWRSINEAVTTIDSSKERWCEAEVYRVSGEVSSNPQRPK